MGSSKEFDAIAVKNFQEYLRIPSVHPNIDYEPCVEFLEKLTKDIGLEFIVFRDVPKNPMVILTWVGKEQLLPTIMLNSHMDVVPVFEDKWTHKPFGADIDSNGDIYARGAQDTKCIGIQYLEAIRRLKKDGFQPRRTVHVTFVPDEEVGGINGIVKYIHTDNFKKLNVGFALDEGMGGLGKTLSVQYGEKRIWHFEIHCSGQSGHGSILLENTPGEKVRLILDKFYDFRAEQMVKEKKDGRNDDIITINLTIMQGGVQNNVIPEEFVLVFDTRVPVERFADFESTVDKWCQDVGKGVWIENRLKGEYSPNTITDSSNKFWVAFKEAIENMGYKVDLRIAQGNTDGRYLRTALIPTFGFSPKQDTPKRQHGNDEFLNVNVFLEGIKIYMQVIAAVSNT